MLTISSVKSFSSLNPVLSVLFLCFIFPLSGFYPFFTFYFSKFPVCDFTPTLFLSVFSVIHSTFPLSKILAFVKPLAKAVNAWVVIGCFSLDFELVTCEIIAEYCVSISLAASAAAGKMMGIKTRVGYSKHQDMITTSCRLAR
jgi:hypothetical protein